MKRFLLPLLAAIALPTTVSASVDHEVHGICLKASDYAGCVKVQTDGIAAPLVLSFRRVFQSPREICALTLMHMLGTVFASVCFAI